MKTEYTSGPKYWTQSLLAPTTKITAVGRALRASVNRRLCWLLVKAKFGHGLSCKLCLTSVEQFDVNGIK